MSEWSDFWSTWQRMSYEDKYANAYIFGYPIVDHYRVTYQHWRSLTPDGEEIIQEFNAFYGEAELFDHNDTIVVTPNNDTCYSKGFIDIEDQPAVLEIDEVDEGRYFSFQCVDCFTNNVAYVGTRVNLLKGRYLFYAPWHRVSAEDKASFDSAFQFHSRFILLLGRTQIFGTEDLARVAEIMDGYRITPPLANKSYDFVPVTVEKVTELEPAEFFGLLCHALQYQNSVYSFEQQFIWSCLSELRIGPEAGFNPPSAGADAVAAGASKGLEQIIQAGPTFGTLHEGWSLRETDKSFFEIANFDDIMFRSCVAYMGLYANSPVEAYYPRGTHDARAVDITANNDAYLLNGQNTYRWTLTEPPPVRGFWSITMYGANQYFVPNHWNVYSLGSRHFANSEQVDIEIRTIAPGESRQEHVLPAPDGPFYVVMRLYEPDETVICDGYQPPGIVKQD